MLTVETGPFFPELENAFVERVRLLKRDPMAPLAVVSPSSRLLDRLQRRLAMENLSLLAVHFHTFTSLAEGVVLADGGKMKPSLSDPLFFDTLIKWIIQDDKPFRGFTDLAIPQGFPVSVRATLRDLMDSGANADIIEAVKEGFLGRDVDLGSLKELLRLYRIYLQRLDKLSVSPRSAVLKAATEKSADSPFLSSFKEILFYGFYDATGVQADFFQAVAKAHPSRFFFPYVQSHPAYAFAGRFRDTFLQPVISEEIIRESEQKRITPNAFSLSGLRDEAALVAREIAWLHEHEKIPYTEMAIVARTRDRLDAELPLALRERDIPFESSSARLFSASPLYKTILNLLREAVKEWPSTAAWADYIDRVKIQLKDVDGVEIALPALERFRAFSVLRERISRDEFLELLEERWRGLEWSHPHSKRPGVSLLHAEASRGHPFRVVFLIGVEEKVFPRIIREDPFLRDDARVALSNTLGYKISQKLTAYEEERLLFELVSASAQERLIITFQRSDDEGKVVGPSLFISDLTPTFVARSVQKKWSELRPEEVTRRDVIQAYLETGELEKGVRFGDEWGGAALSLAPGLRMSAALGDFAAPGPYDGRVPPGPLASLSASALETFGRCPFQYFARHRLGLKAIAPSASASQISADVRGRLVHSFLEKLFKNCDKQLISSNFNEFFNVIFMEVFGALTPESMGLHAVAWEAFVSTIRRDLWALVQLDLEQQQRESYVPAYFEQLVSVRLDAPLDGLDWIGKMDRIDLGAAAWRIVDYKTGRSPSESVVTAALQGRALQGPLYLLMLEKWRSTPAASVREGTLSMPTHFVYMYMDPESPLRELGAEDWAAYKGEIVETVQTYLTLIRNGEHPLIPGDYCAWCDVSSLCRVNDSVSTYRTLQGEAAQSIRGVRAKRAGRKR